MTLNFVCRGSKVSKKDGLTPLELYVIIDGKRRYISLNRRIDPKSFNNKKQLVKGDDQTNEYIEAVRMKCYALETEMLKRGLLFTVDTFIYAFKYGIKKNSISTYALFDEFMEKQEEKKKVGLITHAIYVKYKCTIRYCKEAMETDKMLSDLTTSDMEDIYTYMLGRMANNSAICYMRKLKTMLIYAIREGYISTNPITFKFHKTKVKKEPLTLEEVRRIRTKVLGSRSMENALIVLIATRDPTDRRANRCKKRKTLTISVIISVFFSKSGSGFSLKVELFWTRQPVLRFPFSVLRFIALRPCGRWCRRR